MWAKPPELLKITKPNDVYTTSKRPMRVVGCESKSSYIECDNCNSYCPKDAKYCFRCGEKLQTSEVKISEKILDLLDNDTFFTISYLLISITISLMISYIISLLR